MMAQNTKMYAILEINDTTKYATIFCGIIISRIVYFVASLFQG
jgi:hypothetical protein